MIPNRYAKDQHPLHFYPPPHTGQPYPTSIFIPPILGMDYMEQQKALERAQANMQVNNSIDSLLHVHRRKLQRRAANRKSAQLSRARKKAHLEELTVENARLQQLVDILDSQPELMFCINARGDITYISERTINFVNITGVDSGSDEEPTHILQILRKDSVDSVLSSIQEIIRVSPPKSALAESSMLFSTKVVEFQDSFGHPLVGYLRCARINRRPVEDVPDDDEADPITTTITPTVAAQAKNGNGKRRHDGADQEQELARLASAALPYYAVNSGSGNTAADVQNDPNRSNFQMLTDCMSSMADRHDLSNAAGVVSDSGNSPRHHTGSGSSADGTTTAGTASGTDAEAESEFVCVIRTSDSYFARYSARSDLYMFVSTPLSAASMEAHDRKDGNSSSRPPTNASDSTFSSSARDTTAGKAHSMVGTDVGPLAPSTVPAASASASRKPQRKHTNSSGSKMSLDSGSGKGGSSGTAKRGGSAGSGSVMEVVQSNGEKH